MKVLALDKTGDAYEIRIRRRRWWLWSVEERWVAKRKKEECVHSFSPWHPAVDRHRNWINESRRASCMLCARLDAEVRRLEDYRALCEGMHRALDEVIDLDTERAKRSKDGA